MTLVIANHGTSIYTQGFAGWMQQKTICKEELTHALGQVLQVLFVCRLIQNRVFTVWAQDTAGCEM